ncbi:MAG TPA: hypothetical protein VG602_08450 [Actinomycetota bacterium]|nr:hypothetical protein [Actinomycetota bacterium]
MEPTVVNPNPRQWGARLVVVLIVLFLPSGATASDVAPEPVRPAFGDLSSPLRPGSSLGGYCTFNWVFYEQVYPTETEPNPLPDVYIGTAGHCTDDVGERVNLEGFGPVGTVVYDSDEVRSGVDFSLIQLDASMVGKTNPQMRGFPGPRGSITVSMLEVGDRVDVYGYGIVFGEREETRPRFGVLTEWTQDEYMADMPAVNGDSGAPLLHDETGFALGVISRYGIRVPPSTDLGPMVPWIFRELAKAGFGNVVLATIGG